MNVLFSIAHIRRRLSSGTAAVFLVSLLLYGCNSDPRNPPSSAAESKKSDTPPPKSANKIKLGTPLGEKKQQNLAPSVKPEFADVAPSLGARFDYYNDEIRERFFLPEVMGGGIAWIDFDLDGWLDLIAAQGCVLVNPDPNQRNYLDAVFRSLAGSAFADVRDQSRIVEPHYGQGVAVGDFDQDGFPDIFFANYGKDSLWHNNGDGTFEDVTSHAAVTDDLWGSGAVWFDADRDGDLDLFVVNYMQVNAANLRHHTFGGKPGYAGPGDYNATPDRFFSNNGDGTFTDATQEFGFGEGDKNFGKGLAAAVLDFNDDLIPEIYIANDMCPNFFYTTTPLNLATDDQQKTPYFEIGHKSGCAISDDGTYEASMGIGPSDFDGDGRVDMYLSHFYEQKNTLYTNLGNLRFEDTSRRTRVAATGNPFNSFGVIVIDYDRDTWSDLFVTNGHVLGPNLNPSAMRSLFLRNDTRGNFDDITRFAGDYLQELLLGRCASGADFDNDGDLDIGVSHLHRPMAILQNNTRSARHFIALSLKTASRIPPVGGRVVITTGQRKQSLPIFTGGSYEAAQDERIIAGLGDAPAPDLVEIYWPSGRVDKFDKLSPDAYWEVWEGQPPSLHPEWVGSQR